jgi:hypothetical protein
MQLQTAPGRFDARKAAVTWPPGWPEFGRQVGRIGHQVPGLLAIGRQVAQKLLNIKMSQTLRAEDLAAKTIRGREVRRKQGTQSSMSCFPGSTPNSDLAHSFLG